MKKLKSKLTTEERILEYLLTKYQESKTNFVYIGAKDLETFSLSNKECSRSLYFLKKIKQ